MMEIDPMNIGIIKTIGDMKEMEGNDFDGTTYEFTISDQGKLFEASYYFECFDSVAEIIGKDFFTKNFEEFEVSYGNKSQAKGSDAVYNFTLALNLKDFNQKKRKDKIMEKSEKLAMMKSTFFAAPYISLIDKCTEGDTTPTTFKIREDEHVFCIPQEKDKMTLYYVFRFIDETDATIANLIFNEMVDAKRDINNSPGFTLCDLRKLPKTLTNTFPDEEFPDPKDLAFVLNITLFSKHIKDKEKSAHYLQGLRQYLHYHIQSSKTYLYSRIRKKVALAARQINLAKFESDGIKVYRGRKGKGKVVDHKKEAEDENEIILRAK